MKTDLHEMSIELESRSPSPGVSGSAAGTEIRPGQIWWDKDRRWCDGSDTLDVVYLTLSRDPEPELGGEMYWKAAFFMWCGDGYCGASVRLFTDAEIHCMTLVGNIAAIKGFQPPNHRI